MRTNAQSGDKTPGTTADCTDHDQDAEEIVDLADVTGNAPVKVGACPFDHDECGGISGLFFGELSCWACYTLAPLNAREVHQAWMAEGDHPALTGAV